MIHFLRRQAQIWAFLLLPLTNPPHASAQQLTAEMRAEFGAATWIPQDAGCFTSSHRFAEQWQAFTKTRAYQEILTMPVVQMGLGWLNQQQYFAQLDAMRAEYPLLDDGLDVLLDGFSREVFVYVDARGPRCINALVDLYNSLFWNGFLQGFSENGTLFPGYSEAENQVRLLHDVLAAEQHLRVPGIVIGFRLSDPDAGQKLIADLHTVLPQVIPLPLRAESIGGGEFLTLPLNAGMFFNPEAQAKLRMEMSIRGIDAETMDQIIGFISSQTLSISIGMRGDYLLVSLGADNTHLEQLGTGVSLAASQSLDPVRRSFRPRLLALNYVHPDLTRYGKMDVEGIVAGLQDLLMQMQAELPAGLYERLTSDATQLLNEVNESLPERTPRVSASFWNGGIETFTFSALFPGSLDSSEPLTIMNHAGPAPILALAAHSPPSLSNYESLARCFETLYGYFDEYIVPQIPDENLEDFQQFESVFVPALQQFHVTTRDLLIPSLDGGQSLFVLDSGGAITRSPEDQSELAQPIRFPRPAVVAELDDPDKLVAAGVKYREIFNFVMTKIAEGDSDVSLVQMPPPTARNLEGARLYTYPIPEQYNPASYLGDDFEPHIMLTPSHLVFSLSSLHSQQLLAERSLPQSLTLDLERPAGRAAWFDFVTFKDLLCDDADAILAIVQEENEVDPNVRVLVKIHIDKLRKVLGAMRSYRSRTFEEDGLCVKHSWLHLEDIE